MLMGSALNCLHHSWIADLELTQPCSSDRPTASSRSLVGKDGRAG